ncbi:hypothetical protein F2Q69_00014281 [Brassica cretica]|uniref:Uncharacterized protein n=1 Tax=Brassica cretica TaxID=69181 RepID=A0A8S9QTT4_BRACR|nr:hypothetical protein F2Q69_00014281 [Brassica cretica]
MVKIFNWALDNPGSNLMLSGQDLSKNSAYVEALLFVRRQNYKVLLATSFKTHQGTYLICFLRLSLRLSLRLFVLVLFIFQTQAQTQTQLVVRFEDA